jgi:H+/gluconate symporter-like permease
MHRMTAVASGALDALPHNGAAITLLGVSNLSHRDSSFDVFVASIAGPMISLIFIIILASLFGSV